MNIECFWRDILNQNKLELKKYFHDQTLVNWHCTNESFTVDEFIRANCEYPGEWDGQIEHKYEMGDLIITVTHVYSKNSLLSFHVTSFITIKADKIILIDEYWADDGIAPQWRLDKKIGRTIKP